MLDNRATRGKAELARLSSRDLLDGTKTVLELFHDIRGGKIVGNKLFGPGPYCSEADRGLILVADPGSDLGFKASYPGSEWSNAQVLDFLLEEVEKHFEHIAFPEELPPPSYDPQWQPDEEPPADDTVIEQPVITPAKRKPTRRKRSKEQSGFPDMTDSGKIRNTCKNVRHALNQMGMTCEYDQFHDKLLIGGQPIGQYAGELSDHACLVLRKMVDEEFGFDPGREKMLDSCVQLCLENRFDPIVNYLEGLRWDGVERVDRWLTTYLGADDTQLNRAIGKIALVAQVRRARKPGCKFDQIIVMESPEGYEKSTALTVLAGAAENFSDQTILGQGDKEQQELLRGIWIFEIADLSNIGKAEVEHVKAFASRTHDRARPAYGRAVVNLPRRCIIWATTNNNEYLKSQTGNRRFWPFIVGRINIEALKRNRDQLFAEAVQLDNIKTSIVLPKSLWDAAAEEQEQRREADPWEDHLREVKGEIVDNERRVFTQNLLETQIGIPRDRQTNHHLKRIGECMRILGWKGPKPMRCGKKLARGYWKAVTGVTPNDP